MTQPLSLPAPLPDRWQIQHKPGTKDETIGLLWDVQHDTRLPHEDHVEMSGQQVSVIARYGANAARQGHLALKIIWPMLRIAPDDVRGYLIRTFDETNSPRLLFDGVGVEAATLVSVRFTGALHLYYLFPDGAFVQRQICVSPTQGAVIDQWVITARERRVRVQRERARSEERTQGMYGEYLIEAAFEGPASFTVRAKSLASHVTLYTARRADTPAPEIKVNRELQQRVRFVQQTQRALQLHTPEPVLNAGFALAKVRAAESLFATKRGLMHSPGGGRYYGGVWANDQAEYAGPFFPFLGDRAANEASLNAYTLFAKAMTPDYKPLPTSFEMEGDIEIHAGGDRGDAAMIAYGASRYALARGSAATGKALWPLIAWCLDYCRRKTNADGVVESDTDELEGRFPTGKANLSTSTLFYGALRSTADLLRALRKPDWMTSSLNAEANRLAFHIEKYFGATVEGYETYRYYDGNTTLRAWICLPLTMELFKRRKGTVAALFSPRLWTPDGLATEAGDTVFWDRATLYALRGVFQAGETETALTYLTAYTRRRLLGDHVPYPVEAWPEGGQAHLSAESALYCRIITEGLFGITPTGFRSFRCTPRLPAAWPQMALADIRAFGKHFTLTIKREADGNLTLTVYADPIWPDRATAHWTQPDGTSFDVTLQ